MGYFALILVSFYLVFGEWEISGFADLLNILLVLFPYFNQVRVTDLILYLVKI